MLQFGVQREMYKTEHHSEIADTVSRLVGALGLTGQHREATTMLEKLLDIQKGIAGGNEQNVDVVCTMRDVARGKGSLGDHAEMVRILKRVVEIQTTMHGTENHREVRLLGLYWHLSQQPDSLGAVLLQWAGDQDAAAVGLRTCGDEGPRGPG